MGTHYQIDREEIPLMFYTPIKPSRYHDVRPGQALAMSARHSGSEEGWVSVGYVSKQTPLGQGVFMGFHINEIRPATPREVRRSLRTKHPYGDRFRPRCEEAESALFHLTLSQFIGNWTNDNEQSSGHKSILGVSRQELKDFYRQAMAEHGEIMVNWDRITRRQATAILKSFKEG